VHTEVRPGKHHFDGDYHAISALILARLELGTNRRR